MIICTKNDWVYLFSFFMRNGPKNNHTIIKEKEFLVIPIIHCHKKTYNIFFEICPNRTKIPTLSRDRYFYVFWNWLKFFLFQKESRSLMDVVLFLLSYCTFFFWWWYEISLKNQKKIDKMVWVYFSFFKSLKWFFYSSLIFFSSPS